MTSTPPPTASGVDAASGGDASVGGVVAVLPAPSPLPPVAPRPPPWAPVSLQLQQPGSPRVTLPTLRSASSSLSFSYRSSRAAGSTSPALAGQVSPGMGRASSASPVLQLDNNAAAMAAEGKSSAEAEWQAGGHWHIASPSLANGATSSAFDSAFDSHIAPLRDLLTHSYADAAAHLSTPARVILSTRCEASVLIVEATDLQRCWRLAVDEAAFRAQLERLTLQRQDEQQLCRLIAAALKGNARDAPLVTHSLSPPQPAEAPHAAASSPLLAQHSVSALCVNVALLVRGALSCLTWTLPALSGGGAWDEQKLHTAASSASLSTQQEASASSSSGAALAAFPSPLDCLLERLVQCGLSFAEVAECGFAQLAARFLQLCVQRHSTTAALLGRHSALLIARLTALDCQMAACPSSPQLYHDALHCLSAILSTVQRDVQRVYLDADSSPLDARTRHRLSVCLASTSAETEAALRSDALFAFCLFSRLRPADCAPHFSLQRFLDGPQPLLAQPLSQTASAPLSLSDWLLQLHVVVGLSLLLILISPVEKFTAAAPDLIFSAAALLYVLMVAIVSIQSMLRQRRQRAQQWEERRRLCRFALLCLMIRVRELMAALGIESADYINELYCQRRSRRKARQTTSSQAVKAEAGDEADSVAAEPVQPSVAAGIVNDSSSSGVSGSRVASGTVAAGKRARSKKRRTNKVLEQPLLTPAAEAAINKV